MESSARAYHVSGILSMRGEGSAVRMMNALHRIGSQELIILFLVLIVLFGRRPKLPPGMPPPGTHGVPVDDSAILTRSTR